MPLPVVALPCGSKSTTSTLCWAAANEAARLTVVVVLPTPPFWLATAKMCALIIIALHNKRYRIVPLFHWKGEWHGLHRVMPCAIVGSLWQ